MEYMFRWIFTFGSLRRANQLNIKMWRLFDNTGSTVPILLL
jgi:hypothetical protein